MSPPRRLRDPDGGGSPEVRAMLSHARRTPERDDATRARTRARVRGLAAAPAVTLVLWTWGKSIAVAAGVGLVGAVIVATALPAPRRAPAAGPSATHAPRIARGARGARVSAAPSGAPSAVPSALTSAAVEARPAATTSARGSSPRAYEPRPVEAYEPPPVAAPSAEPTPSVAAFAPEAHAVVAPRAVVTELQLLERAQSELTRDPREALRVLAEYAEAYPSGRQRVEHDRLVIEALFAAGRAGEARARAEAFLARDPTSLYAERVRQLLRRAAP